jgi:hypothetical protein
VELTPEMKAAVELMHMMNTKDGSLELYDEVFKWHMKHQKTEASAPHKKLHAVLSKDTILTSLLQ